SSVGAPAEAHGGHLVEGALLAPCGGAVVLAAVPIPEPLQDLVLAGGDGELGVAARDLRALQLQLAHALAALRLHALDVGLTCAQLARLERRRRGGLALFGL